MEHFGARDERPKDECLRLISKESNSFVGIYAHRYGHIPRRCHKSITEAEFDAATLAKLPRFVYVVDDEAPWNPKFIDDGDARSRLVRLKRRLQDGMIVKPFNTKDQLAMYVAADLGRHLATTQLKRVEAGQAGFGSEPTKKRLKTIEAWNRHRDGIYKTHRGYFLVHTLSPSRRPGQRFDIFIYLQKHKSQSTPEVAYAEFFFGRYWGDRIFRVRNEGGLIGISTSAYGEFLCTCSVVFRDRSQLMLERYIDFGTNAPSIDVGLGVV